jgi:hypothetical protein
VPISVEEVVGVKLPPVGLGKKSSRNAMPLLVKVGRIAHFAVSLQFHAKDTHAYGDDAANRVFVRPLPVSLDEGALRSRVLAKQEVVAKLIFDSAIN